MTDLNPANPDDVPTFNIGVPTATEKLLAQVIEAKAQAADNQENQPVTIADVAAAAFVALETLVSILPEPAKSQLIDEYERRSTLFAATVEEGN